MPSASQHKAPRMVLALHRFAALAACLVAVCLFSTGCQSGPRTQAYIEMMNAERRGLEDRVYALEGDLQILEQELETYRQENMRLRRELNGESERSAPSSSGPGRAPRRLPGVHQPESEPRRPARTPDLAPPMVEEGEPDPVPPSQRTPPDDQGPPPTAPPQAPHLDRNPAAHPNPKLGPNVDGPAKPGMRPDAPPADLDPPGAEPADPVPPRRVPGAPAENRRVGPPRDALPPPAGDEGAEPKRPEGAPNADGDPGEAGATQATDEPVLLEPPMTAREPAAARPASSTSAASYLTLNPQATGGADFDDSPGDDGVTLAFTLRDEQGRAVQESGSLAVVLLDPARQGPAARVARWDLDARQLERLARGQHRGEVTLHLAWPEQPPSHARLKIYVRFATEDGRRLEADRDLTIRLAGQPLADGWKAKSGTGRVVPASAELRP